jgi:Carboxypeptidase regulatory-like domain
MFRLSRRVVLSDWFVWMIFSLVANFTWAQSETATVSGQVVDPSGLNITAAQVKLVDIDRDTSTNTKTNYAGLYTFPSVRPGRYRMEVSVAGFRVVNVTGLTVNVQDHLEQNFKLVVGSTAESVTVEGQSYSMNTESATVSTVVDRNFAENLPLNGRSFQTLIDLTPGVVLTSSNLSDNGQFSVNGQRASSNYWTVDGVSANVGSSSGANPGNGMGGTAAGFSAMGGTNGLVSVDALQEFRIQTSTYAPEFGRTPGGQISIVTRSGTNRWHGTVFDYLRNDILDANDWFADEKGLIKPRERQNDFGATLSGPVFKNKTFFFFSYEGLRLRLPRVTLTDVPCDNSCRIFGDARKTAVLGMQPYLNAFPLPNGPEVLTQCDAATDPACPPSGQEPTGSAQFDASYSNPAGLNAYSIRIDHKISDNFTLFGRYDYSPSEFIIRGGAQGVAALNVIQPSDMTIETGTVGATLLISSVVANDIRFNYSRTDGSSSQKLDDFGGAMPLRSLPFPSPFTSQNANFSLVIQSLGTGGAGAGSFIFEGPVARNRQKQINIVDNLTLQRGQHNLKLGVDFRRLTPLYNPPSYSQDAFFQDISSAETGDSAGAFISSSHNTQLLFRNLGCFAQDTWRLLPTVTLTYGLRWDVDYAPSSLNGVNIPGLTGYSLTNLSSLAIAPAGSPAFKTTYGNLAPRFGLAYQMSQSQNWSRVFRGGFGVFYDLVSSEAGNLVGNGYPPFGALTSLLPGTVFPYAPAQIAPPPIPAAGTLSELYAFNPSLRQPYTLEWNVALEQGLGTNQSVSVSYVGASGRRLLQTTYWFLPVTNPNITSAFLVDNTASSDYDALQIQFERRLSRGVQALASYSWAHSIDDGSAGSLAIASNNGTPGGENVNRAASDFDIRHSLSAAVAYDLPTPKTNKIVMSMLGDWSVQGIVLARSAPPVDISDQNLFNQFAGGLVADARPDLVPAQPLYLHGQQYPGGKAFNPAAFTDPPIDPTTGTPLRQGDTPRNFMRGFGATQLDFAVHRDFPIRESLKLQFRAEMFNVINHPSFGPPNGGFGTSSFGISNEMLGQSLSGYGGAGSGALSPLYQIGGPRSIQLALKLQF